MSRSDLMAPSPRPVQLNVECGTDIPAGWINLNSAALPDVDVRHDLTALPLPFEGDSFDHILCQDVLEHVQDYAKLLKDLHRILKPTGTLDVRFLHFTSKDVYSDPTRARLFSAWIFIYSSQQHPRNYWFDFAFSAWRVEGAEKLSSPKANCR